MKLEGGIILQLDQLQNIFIKLQDMLGFSPVALIFVIVIVSVFGKPLANILKLKQNAKSLFLILLSVIISLLAVITSDNDQTFSSIAFKTILFSSLSSFAYDILKPVVTAFVAFGYAKVERYTGIKIQDEDIIESEEIENDGDQQGGE